MQHNSQGTTRNPDSTLVKTLLQGKRKEEREREREREKAKPPLHDKSN